MERNNTHHSAHGLEEVIARGAIEGEIASAEEVGQFCERLSDLTGMSAKDVYTRLTDVELPKSFHSARLFDARTNEEIGSCWMAHPRADKVRIDTPRLVAAAMMNLSNKIVAWRKVTAANDSAPGILELLVDVDMRPRRVTTDGYPDVSDYVPLRIGE